jgi:flagellar operon protein (TIGR03826 family)
MPDIRNCRRCGRIYNYIGGPPICIDCRNADEEIFKKVKEYLYDNPKATLSQVSMECNVSVEKIKMFLKEGRLEITDGANIVLECERCGKPINTGRYCNDCQNQVTNDIIAGTAVKLDKREETKPNSEAKRNGVGLRYLNKNI